MKKAIIILMTVVSILCSSCYLWNATMDNVIRTYNLQYGLNSDYEYHLAWFRVFKTGNSILFSKLNDYDPYDTSYVYDIIDYDTTCTEIFGNGTGSEPGSSFSLQYTRTDCITDVFHLADGTPLYKTESIGSIMNKQIDNWGNVFISTRIAAVREGYGYILNTTDDTLDVFDIGSWLESAAVSDTLDAGARISSQPVPGISEFTTKDIMISGDHLVFRVDSSNDNFYGVVFFDISDPANPIYRSKKETEGIAEYYYNIYYHLEDNELLAYGSDANNRFFYIWDVSDPTNIPAAIDISTEMTDFLDGISYPHLISGRLAVYYNIYEPVLNVWDFSNPGKILTASEAPRSTWKPAVNRNYPWNSVTLEDNMIFIAAGNNVEVWQYSSGNLNNLATGYVGVPLLGAYKFPGDPYIYALGYDSINVVSVKY